MSRVDPLAPASAANDAILDLVHESIFVRGLDLTISFWNTASEQLYGWTRDEAVGRHADDLLHCIHPVSLADREAQLFETGRWEGEFERTTKSGATVIVEAKWAVSRDESGNPTSVIETGRDISERRRAEEEARISEYRFRNLFEAVAVAFWEIDFNAVGQTLRGLFDGDPAKLRNALLADRPLVRKIMREARVVDVNAKTVELFEAGDKGRMIGGDVDRYWPTASEPVFIESLVATMSGSPHFIAETLLTGHSGAPINALLTVSWSPESRKRGVILLGVIDVSERRKAVEDIARSEAKYRNMFNFMPIAMWQLDSRRMREMFVGLADAGVTDIAAYVADHPEFLDKAQATLRITEANEQTIKLFGGTDREATIEAIPDLWVDRMDWVASNEARLAGKQSYSGESRIRTMDGRSVDVVFSVAFADPDNPESWNTVGAIDVSELKATAAALAQSELKYRDLFHHMPIALAQLDVRELIDVLGQLRKDGVTDLAAYMDEHPKFLSSLLEMMRVEQVNEHTVRMFGGRDTAEFVGPITRFWRGSEDTVRRSLAARFAGAEAYAEETRLRSLGGEAIDVFYTSAFPKALSELGIGLVGMIDIGDRLQAERMLQKLQADFAHAARVATLGELTASIAHEVNQPLAAITTNGEASLRWLDRPEPDIEEVRTLSARIVADARRAADVIAHIRAMAARQAPVQQPLLLNDAIEDALDFLRNDLRLHGVRVEFEPDSALPLVVVDRTQIQQVLVNLAVNAQQAMERHGKADRRLLIRTRVDERGRACVEVDDNGPGLPADVVPRLFDSFFTTKDDGLGLGLSICRSIIEVHGGEMRAENRAEGGARFSFALPPQATADHTKV